MQKAIPLMVAVAASLGTSACNKDAEATDTAAVTSAIKAQEAQWVKDFAAKDVDAIDGHFASDGAAAGPGYIATTDADRRSLLQRWMGDPNFKMTFAPDSVDVAKSGDLATSRGQFTMMMTGPDKKVEDVTGSYLSVYKKDPEGHWKVVNRFLTRGPEEAAEAAAAKAPAAT